MEAICLYDYQIREALVDHLNEESKKQSICKKRHIGYYGGSGIFFSGELTHIIRDFAIEVYKIPIKNFMAAFVDVELAQVKTGIHDVTVYDEECCFYKWGKGEYAFGRIVLKSSKVDNVAANVCLQSMVMKLCR